MRTASAAACLTCEALSVDVYCCPSLATAIVTHLVTRLVHMPGGSAGADLPIFQVWRMPGSGQMRESTWVYTR
jgi:hypothetical protein